MVPLNGVGKRGAHIGPKAPHPSFQRGHQQVEQAHLFDVVCTQRGLCGVVWDLDRERFRESFMQDVIWELNLKEE